MPPFFPRKTRPEAVDFQPPDSQLPPSHWRRNAVSGLPADPGSAAMASAAQLLQQLRSSQEHPASGKKYPSSGTIKRLSLVLDAGGAIGAGVVAALLAAGDEVIAVGSDAAALGQLARTHAGAPLLLLDGSTASEAQAAALAMSLHQRRRRPSRAVVHIPPSLQRCRLLECEAGFLRDALDRHLLPHLAAARHLLPLLGRHEGGSEYLIVDGPGAGFAWAGYVHRSVVSASVRMLALGLHHEARSHAVRLRLLSLGTPVRDADGACACPDWPNAHEVGRQVSRVLDQRDNASAEVRLGPRAGTHLFDLTPVSAED